MAFLLKSIYIHLICYKNLILNLVLTKWSQIQEPNVNGLMAILLDLDMDLPEKIGGWSQLTNSNNTLPGAARAQHAFASYSW